jgi:hypothetical protein
LCVGTTKPKLPRHAKGEPYIGGPIPLDWVTLATTLPGRTWVVASVLWFVAIRERRKCATVNLTLKTLRRFNINRKSLYRALKALEGAGLVCVGRQAGRRLSVTILPAPRWEDS